MGCTLQENVVKITEVEIAYVLLNVKRGTKKQVIKVSEIQCFEKLTLVDIHDPH